jgi:hypothetical protein
VATTIKIPKNIYILNEIEKERCFLGNKNESWLWHRRMGHMKFDYLVKINKEEAVREILEILKPSNTMCKHYCYNSKCQLCASLMLDHSFIHLSTLFDGVILKKQLFVWYMLNVV